MHNPSNPGNPANPNNRRMPHMSAYRMMCQDPDGSAFSVYAFQPEKLNGYERTVKYVLDRNEAKQFKAMAIEQRRIGSELSGRIHKNGGVLVQESTPEDDFGRWQRPGFRPERPQYK